MLAIKSVRDIPREVRDLILVETFDVVPVPDDAVIMRGPYSLTTTSRGLVLAIHKDHWPKTELDRLVIDVYSVIKKISQ